MDVWERCAWREKGGLGGGVGMRGVRRRREGDGLRWVNTVSGVVLVKTRSRE